MKKRLLYLFLIINLIFYSCKKPNQDKCLEGIKLSNIEISRGNIYYIHKINYSEAIQYLVFKKYKLIDYLQFYPITTDSCFKIEMDKKIESKINKKIIFLSNEIEKLKEEEESIEPGLRGGNLRYIDSIYMPIGDIEQPLLKYPMQERNFKEYLVKNIKKNLDSTYRSSSFWIVVNKKGEVEKIESYKKHSIEVDGFIEKELKRTLDMLT